MSVTTMKLQSQVRDELARVASEDYAGVTLSDAVARLLAEHGDARTRHQISAAYAQLMDDAEQWAGYVAELDMWDGVSADRADDR